MFREVEAEMQRKVAAIVKEREAGLDVIPTVAYADVKAGTVSPEMIAKIKDRGACVVRQTFPAAQASAWNDEIGTYVDGNGLTEKLAHAAVDNYFGDLASAKPQIAGHHWSRPQVQARQSEELTRVRVFLNKLWKAESEGKQHFNPDETPAYADRIRRRPPGSASLGLSPHVDGGSERLVDTGRATFLPAIGGSTTPSTRRTGPRCKRLRRQRCAPCFAPFRDGRR